MKTMNQEKYMEAAYYMNSLQGRFEATEEEKVVVNKFAEQGFNKLNEQEKQALVTYFNEVSTITMTAKFLEYSSILAASIDPTITARAKEVDWSIIEKPIRNQKDYSEFEAKKLEKDLIKLGTNGQGPNPNNNGGFDENGRPYISTRIGDTNIKFHLDTREYEFKAI